jgi:LmbE family N-acetylglucosaminyl deacetylase
MAAMKALGVTAVRVNDFQNDSLKVDQVAGRVDFWTRRNDPGLDLAGVAGKQDFHYHPDHGAIYQALRDANFARTRWYMVYQQGNLFAAYTASRRIDVRDLCNQKRKALREYAYVNHAQKRYGVAWNYSTPALLDGAYRDCAEYELTDHDTPGDQIDMRKIPIPDPIEILNAATVAKLPEAPVTNLQIKELTAPPIPGVGARGSNVGSGN